MHCIVEKLGVDPMSISPDNPLFADQMGTQELDADLGTTPYRQITEIKEINPEIPRTFR